MSEEVLSIGIEKSPFVPWDYFVHARKSREYKLAVELFEKISTGEFFTVRIVRQKEPDFYDWELHDGERWVYNTSVYLGKVIPIRYEWKPPKKLNWKERLRILFTGEVPLALREE